MTLSHVDSEIPLERRRDLLTALPSFADLEESVLNEIARSLGVERFAVGDVIMHETQFGDRMYMIESGVVGVFTDGPSGAVQLGNLATGDRFGEVSFQSSTRRRRVTVTALTPVVVLTLTATRFEQLSGIYPALMVDLTCAAETFMQARLEALMQAKSQKMNSINRSPLGF